MFGVLIDGLSTILFPKTCVVCKNKLKGGISVDNFVCLACWGKISKNAPPFCHSCGRHIGKSNSTKNICPKCIRQPLHFDRAFSPCNYDGPVKELIHAFKYSGKDYLGKTLSNIMSQFILEYNLPINYTDYIIPIPLHSSKLREREFNQAQILSNHIGKTFNKPVLSNALMRFRATKAQVQLDTEDRMQNVANSFSLRRDSDIRGKDILLVDDVLTTGATASEASKTLKDAGARIIFVLTLAN